MAPVAVRIAAVDAQTRLAEVAAPTGKGATFTFVVPVVMPQPFSPDTV